METGKLQMSNCLVLCCRPGVLNYFFYYFFCDPLRNRFFCAIALMESGVNMVRVNVSLQIPSGIFCDEII